MRQQIESEDSPNYIGRIGGGGGAQTDIRKMRKEAENMEKSSTKARGQLGDLPPPPLPGEGRRGEARRAGVGVGDSRD